MRKNTLLIIGLAFCAGLIFFLSWEWKNYKKPSSGYDLNDERSMDDRDASSDRGKEPYFYEMVDRQMKNLEKQRKEGEVPGLKSFNKWRAFWEPRVGKYGKFSQVSEHLQNSINNGQDNRYFCDSEANWTEIGPTSFPDGASGTRGIGRLDFVKLHPNYNGTSNQTVFVGGFPGLWKTIDNGAHWVNMNTDDLELTVSGWQLCLSRTI